MTSSTTTRESYSGWAAFAGVIMFIVGSLNAFWGLAGILNDDVVVVGGHGAIIADITTWGWIHLILGSIIGTIGLAAAVMYLSRGRRRERVLLWFGLFAGPYGLRLITKSKELVRAVAVFFVNVVPS